MKVELRNITVSELAEGYKDNSEDGVVLVVPGAGDDPLEDVE